MNIAEMHSWFDILQDKGDSPYFTTDEKTQFLNRAQTKFVNETLNKFFYNSAAQPEKSANPHSTIESIQAGEDALSPLIGSLESNNPWVQSSASVNQSSGLGHVNADTPALNMHGIITQKQLDHYVQGMLRTRHSLKHNAFTWKNTSCISVINMSWAVGGKDVHFRYARQQDYRKMKRNAFTEPAVQDPVYFTSKVDENGRNFRIDPAERPTIVASTAPSSTSVYDLWHNTSDVVYTLEDASSPGTVGSMPAANLNALRLTIEAIRTPLQMNYDPDTFDPYPTTTNTNVSCELPDFTHDEIMAIALDDAGVASRDEALVQLNQASKSNITPQ